MTRQLILGLLRHTDALHGYALVKQYTDATGRRLSTGNFYRALHGLEQSGLVRASESAPDADPRRRPYAITEAGAEAFDAWLTGPCHDGVGGPDDDGHSLRAFFVLKSRSPHARHVLKTWREELRASRSTLLRACEESLARGDDDGAFAPAALWHRRRLQHVETDLEFVEQLEKALECNGHAATNGTRAAAWPPRSARRDEAQPGELIP